MFSKILPLALQGNPRFWSTKEHSYPDILPFCFLGLNRNIQIIKPYDFSNSIQIMVVQSG